MDIFPKNTDILWLQYIKLNHSYAVEGEQILFSSEYLSILLIQKHVYHQAFVPSLVQNLSFTLISSLIIGVQ